MRLLRNIVKIISVLLLVVVLAGVAGYAYLTSQAGLDRIVREVNARAGGNLHIEGLRGQLRREVSLAQIMLHDAQGPWLEVHDVTVVWSPRALLQGQAPLQSVKVGQVVMHRQPLPDANAGDAAVSKSDPVPWNEYVRYLPQQVTINEAIAEEPVAGIRQRVTLNGKGDATRYMLALSTLEGTPLSLQADVMPDGHGVAATLAFHEEKGGVIAALAGLPNNIALQATGDIRATMAGDLEIKQAMVQAGNTEIRASGHYRTSDATVDMALNANLPDMTLLQAMTGEAVSASALLKATAQGTPKHMQLRATLTTPHVQYREHRVEEATVNLTATLNPEGFATSDFAATATLDAAMQYQGEPLQFSSNMDLQDRILSLQEMRGNYRGYAFAGALKAQGNPQQFDLDVVSKLTGPDIATELTLAGAVDSQAQRYEGNAKAKLEYQHQRFAGAADLKVDAQHADLSGLTFDGPGVAMRGAITFDLAQQLADGTLSVDARDLAPLGRALKQPLVGALQADVVMANKGGKQQVQAKGHARNLQTAGLRLDHADWRVDSTDLHALEIQQLQVNAQSLRTDSVQADQLQVRASGSLKKALTVEASGKGTMQQKPWQLSFAATAKQPQAQHYQCDVTVLQGHYNTMPFALKAPATARYSASESSLTPLVLQVAGGSVTASAQLKPQHVQGSIVAKNIALQQLPVEDLPQMQLDAQLSLKGTATKPQLQWNARSTGIIEGMKTQAELSGDWVENRLSNGLALTADQAHVSAQTELNVRLSLQPFHTSISPQTPLAGTVKAALPLAMFNTQLRAMGHRVAGTFGGEASLIGTLGNPGFEGKFNLADGRYDHSDTGICLRDMQASIAGTKQAVTLQHFSATDSNKKQFTAKGALRLGGTPTFEGLADFDHFKLFCGGMMTGELDGGIGITGTPQAMTVAGTLELGPLNIQIPGARTEGKIPQVETVWVRPGERTTDDASPSRIALDIALNATRQLFIRGRGLDAEFEGALHIGGTTSTPKIDGQFDKRRGTFVLLDRVMQLDTATVQFQGPIPPSPFLNVVAVTKVNDKTITVTLGGTALAPKLTLSSSPSLPQDEQLALLLFGRELKQISPFEALQLAQATRVLAGLDGGGPGLIGTIRDSLGLDRLDVGSDTDNNLSVSTGKYVTDDVYVGVVQGTKPEDREVVTEITLTPSVSGKTSVDSIGNQSVGVEWKHDY